MRPSRLGFVAVAPKINLFLVAPNMSFVSLCTPAYLILHIDFISTRIGTIGVRTGGRGGKLTRRGLLRITYLCSVTPTKPVCDLLPVSKFNRSLGRWYPVLENFEAPGKVIKAFNCSKKDCMTARALSNSLGLSFLANTRYLCYHH